MMEGPQAARILPPVPGQQGRLQGYLGETRLAPISHHTPRTDLRRRWPPGLQTAAWPRWPWTAPLVSAAVLFRGPLGAGSRTCSAIPAGGEQSEGCWRWGFSPTEEPWPGAPTAVRGRPFPARLNTPAPAH